MKMNNMNDRNMDKDMRELTPEELEQIPAATIQRGKSR